MNRIQFVWGEVGFLGFACCALGQGVITNIERVIEQIAIDPNNPSSNPAVDLNCDRSADLDLAVGPNRIVYTSNCKVRLVDPGAPAIALDEIYLRRRSIIAPTTTIGTALAGEGTTSIMPVPGVKP